MDLCCFEQEDEKKITPKKLFEICKTGDLVLWKGSGLFSFIINLALASPITHVGMILKFQNETIIYGNKKHIKLESGVSYFVHSMIEETSDVNDLFINSPKEGVQINTLDSILKSSSNQGKVYYRRLLIDAKYKVDKKSMIKFIEKNHSKSYEKNYGELINSASGSNKSENTDYFFCSELVAYLYQAYGVASELNQLPNNITPLAFSEESKGFREEFVFRGNIKLSETFKIDNERG